MNIATIIRLSEALQPFIVPATVGVTHIVGALRGAGAITDTEVDADLQALIVDALAAKAEADRAAAGDDPR